MHKKINAYSNNKYYQLVQFVHFVAKGRLVTQIWLQGVATETLSKALLQNHKLHVLEVLPIPLKWEEVVPVF